MQRSSEKRIAKAVETGNGRRRARVRGPGPAAYDVILLRVDYLRVIHSYRCGSVVSRHMTVDDELQVLFVADTRYLARELHILEYIPDPIVEIIAVRRNVVVEDVVLELIEYRRELRDILHRLAVRKHEEFLLRNVARQIVHAHTRCHGRR